MSYENIRVSFILAPPRAGALHLEQVLERYAKQLELCGVLVPPSSEARAATFNAMGALDMKKPVEMIRQDFFTTLVGDRKNINTIIAIAPNLLGNIMRPFNREMIFPAISGRLQTLETIFADRSPQYFTVLRNPISYAISLYSESLFTGNLGSLEEYLGETDLSKLRWSAALEDLSEKLSVGQVSVWRFEDYPAVLPPLVAGLGNIEPFPCLVHKSIEPTNPGLSAEGNYTLWEYLTENADAKPEDVAETIASLKREHPSLDPAEDTFLLPKNVAQTIGYAYDDDCYYIERLKGFRMIHPDRN